MVVSIRAHYDNLKVSRSAPPEVITAAYRALSKRLHPDMHPGDPRAERVMRIVNASYEVLSDPIKRKAHDDWIHWKEEAEVGNVSATPPVSLSSTRIADKILVFSNFRNHLFRFGMLYLVVGLFAWAMVYDDKPPAPSGLPEYVAEPSQDVAEGSPETLAYAKPASAPNGSAWPQNAGYIKGYPISRADGLSKLTIDNTTNSEDMFVKLISLEANRTVPIRHAYIPAYQSFTMNKVRAGSYDVRYMDMSDGSLTRSESFALEEFRTAGSTRFSVTTMTLYKVENGNMQSYGLSPDEF